MPSTSPPTLFPLPHDLEPVGDAETAEALTTALQAVGGGLSRTADLAMACSCGRLVADRLASAGYIVCRPVRLPE